MIDHLEQLKMKKKSEETAFIGTFTIDKERNLLTETLSGEVTLDDLISFTLDKIKHKNFKDGMNIISDVRKVKLVMAEDEMQIFANFFMRHLDRFKGGKFALVHGNPGQYVFSYFYKRFETKPGNVETFSTLEEAYSWALNLRKK